MAATGKCYPLQRFGRLFSVSFGARRKHPAQPVAHRFARDEREVAALQPRPLLGGRSATVIISRDFPPAQRSESGTGQLQYCCLLRRSWARRLSGRNQMINLLKRHVEVA